MPFYSSLYPSAFVSQIEGLLLALITIRAIDLQFVTPVHLGGEKNENTPPICE